MKKINRRLAATGAACLLLLISASIAGAADPDFKVPDTGITKCYDSVGNEILPCPGPGNPYYGQDGNLILNGMNYTDNDPGNPAGTVTDTVTDLLWQKSSG